MIDRLTPTPRRSRRGAAGVDAEGTGPLPRRLLGVWAHPDDEAYLSAGLMARVVDAGGAVTVVTATRGENGTDDPTRFGQAWFGQAREAELVASLAALGVSDLRVVGLADGRCDVAVDEVVVRTILGVMGQVRPDTVVTFGPDGITNHPDHRAVSRWTTEAWRRSAVPQLLYATQVDDHVARFQRVHDEIGFHTDFGGDGPVSIRRSDLAFGCSLTAPELDRKRRALGAHASQTTGLARLMGEETYRAWWQEETFRRPTSLEVHSCPVPAWLQPVHGPVRAAAGGVS